MQAPDKTPTTPIPDDSKTTDSFVRYAAYTRNIARLLRYAAYTSDVGEAFRPVVHPYFVTGSYIVSWGYVAGDVTWEGKNAYDHGARGNTLYQHVAKRATFQAVASMLLPAFTIHSVVHFVRHHVAPRTPLRIRSAVPTMCGLACIPALPLYDKPVEHATELLFDRFWPVNEANETH